MASRGRSASIPIVFGTHKTPPLDEVMSKTIYVGFLSPAVNQPGQIRLLRALGQRVNCNNVVPHRRSTDGFAYAFFNFPSATAASEGLLALVDSKMFYLNRNRPDERLFNWRTAIRWKSLQYGNQQEGTNSVLISCKDRGKLLDLCYNGLGRNNFTGLDLSKSISFRTYVANVHFNNPNATQRGRVDLTNLATGEFSNTEKYGSAVISFPTARDIEDIQVTNPAQI